MRVVRLNTWDRLAELEASWNLLAADMPMRSWDWLATWWKHYGPRPAHVSEGEERGAGRGGSIELFVLAVYDDGSEGRLVGIAPWVLRQSAVRGRVVRWLGDGEVCTDHNSILCAPHDARRVAARLGEALAEEFDDWDRMELSAVDAGDVAVSELAAVLAEQGCSARTCAGDACWVLELPPTWETYLAGVSKSHRKQLRQLERRVLQSSRCEWHTVENACDFEKAWPIVVDLHQRRRRGLGEAGCFASRAFHDYHHEVARRLLKRGFLRMSWLALDGSPIAAEYGLAGSGTTFAYQGGVDPDRLPEEPGRLSTILFLQRAIAEGHTRFDFLRGNEPYKLHWRAATKSMQSYRIVANRPMARLRGRALAVGDALSGLARQGVRRLTVEASPPPTNNTTAMRGSVVILPN